MADMIEQPSSATAAETIDRVFKPIQQFTRGWMMASSTGEYGVSIGMRTGREFWVVGRGGVIGSCPPDVAAGALAFHAPDHVRAAWTNLPPGMTHGEVAEHYLTRIVAWGAEALAEFDPDRLERIDRWVAASPMPPRRRSVRSSPDGEPCRFPTASALGWHSPPMCSGRCEGPPTSTPSWPMG